MAEEVKLRDIMAGGDEEGAVEASLLGVVGPPVWRPGQNTQTCDMALLSCDVVIGHNPEMTPMQSFNQSTAL